MSMKISIANQKGGVGKTVSVINIGAALAKHGYRVLLFDFDSQCDLTGGLKSGVEFSGRTTVDFYKGIPLRECIHKKTDNLDFVPGSRELADLDYQIANVKGSPFRVLTERFQNDSLDDYDFVIFDCPPSLGYLTTNALVASDRTIIPVNSEPFALDGMRRVVETIKDLILPLTPSLKLTGILLTQHREFVSLPSKIRKRIDKLYPDILFKTTIRQCSKIPEVNLLGSTVYDIYPKSNAAIDYMEVTNEFLKRVGYVKK